VKGEECRGFFYVVGPIEQDRVLLIESAASRDISRTVVVCREMHNSRTPIDILIAFGT